MEHSRMDTLLELYDAGEPILNVAGAWHLQPRNIIFFYYELEDAEEVRKALAQMFNRIGMNCNVRMEHLDRLDIRDMVDWVKAHQDELGEYAVDLTGGDDEMLFQAGVCYASFPCRLYTRKPDGRYIALPSGEALLPGAGEFNVAQRLALNDVTVDRYGRLTPDELKKPLLTLADQLFALQKKHPRQWTEQTSCFQQCAARAEDGALTLLLDYETCLEFGISAGTSKLLPQLLRIGALTSIKTTREGIWVTFASGLIKECLCDFGIWLELVAYDAIRSCGQFDDVQLSCVVRWENEKLVNELDVIATAGLGLLIVSCKTCAPDLKAVAELNVLGDRLGSMCTERVLLALPKANEKLDNIRARCEEMNVKLVDLRQLDRRGLMGQFGRVGMLLRTGRVLYAPQSMG